jgi:hypothetical protein
MTEKDLDTLQQMLGLEEQGFTGMCATSGGYVSHLRKLERMGLVKCEGFSQIATDFYDPYTMAEDSEYLTFSLTDKGRKVLSNE